MLLAQNNSFKLMTPSAFKPVPVRLTFTMQFCLSPCTPCVPGYIHFNFTVSMQCSCPDKVHTVVWNMCTNGTYYLVITLHFDPLTHVSVAVRSVKFEAERKSLRSGMHKILTLTPFIEFASSFNFQGYLHTLQILTCSIH